MRSPLASLALAAVLGLSCATAPKPQAQAQAQDESSGLPFIEDDYPRAAALAKSRKVPLFVDAWAPW